MSRGQITKDIIRNEVLKIKEELSRDSYWTSDPRGFAQKYLNKVLDKIDEYRV